MIIFCLWKSNQNNKSLSGGKRLSRRLWICLNKLRAFKLAHVLDAIYNEENNDDMMKVVAMFDRGGDATELENVLELVTDAWNYFPHKVLGGISPAEQISNHQKHGKDK